MPCAGVTKHPKIFGKEPCPHPRGNQRGSREATAEAHEEAGSLLGWVEQVRERQHRRVVFGYELALLEHVGDGAVAATGLEPAQDGLEFGVGRPGHGVRVVGRKCCGLRWTISSSGK